MRASGSQRRGGPSAAVCKGRRTQSGVEWKMRGAQTSVNVQRGREKGKEGGEKQRAAVKGSLRSGQYIRGTGSVRHRRHVHLRKSIRQAAHWCPLSPGVAPRSRKPVSAFRSVKPPKPCPQLQNNHMLPPTPMLSSAVKPDTDAFCLPCPASSAAHDREESGPTRQTTHSSFTASSVPPEAVHAIASDLRRAGYTAGALHRHPRSPIQRSDPSSP